MYRLSLASIALATACAGSRPPASPAAVGNASPAASEAGPSAAFRAYAADLLRVSPRELEGGPNDPRSPEGGQHIRGRAQQYAMWRKGDVNNPVRGWALADGTVISVRKNLGVLFAEAGVWAHPPVKPLPDLAQTLAEDIVWSYGSHDELVTVDAFGLGPPVLQLADDGSGRLRFFSNDHGMGPGIFGVGGGAPPDVFWQNDVVLAADHTATWSKVEFHPKYDR